MRNNNYYFATANTGNGFINNFNDVNINDGTNYLYILKGGPGTGKSTLLKKIGEHFEECGEHVEYFICSSDTGSLDGVRLKRHNICVYDGTNPHALDVNNLGLDSQIINLGECVNSQIIKNSEKISKLVKEKSKCFKCAYSYLKSASEIAKVNFELQKEKIKNTDADKILFSIFNKIEKDAENDAGVMRKFFLSAIDENGEYSLKDLNSFGEVIELNFDDAYCSKFLEKVANGFVALNYEVIGFYNLLNVEFLDAVFVAKLNKLYVIKKDDGGHCKKCEIEKNKKNIEKLLKNGGKCLKNAKKMHKNIEKYYIKNMDYKKLNEMSNNLIIEIEKKINAIN